MMSRQVFWLPRLFSSLPIPLVRKSGSQRLYKFPSGEGRGYSGGTAPGSHGIPY
jgi:hypothetical protein